MAQSSAVRVWFLTGIALLGAGFAWLRAHGDGQKASYRDLEADPSPAASAFAQPREKPALADEASCDRDELVPPTGRPVGLSCAQARAVLQEIRERFATDVPPAAPGPFAEGVKSWLDPHGLWSAAEDAPVGALLGADAVALLDEISLNSGSSAPCATAAELGGALAHWVTELRDIFDAASRAAPRATSAEAATLAAAPAFEDGEVTVPARELAAELGRRVGTLEQALGATLAPFVHASRERFVPVLDAREWQRVVLAAAVRAYVSVVDPHGAWAPLDEEWSLYADDPSFYDDGRLWSDMLRTSLGVRVVEDPTPPLERDDLVLAIEGVATAGLSVEQVEQLARAESGRSPPGERSVVVLRRGETAPRDLVVAPGLEPPDTGDEDTRSTSAGGPDDEMALELVPYGQGTVAIISVRYVGDDLGDRLASVVTEVRRSPTPPVGILLDLRGNGGGSTDGAAAALGIFQPGVPAFPLLNHGHVTEVLVAPAAASEARWRGPVAVLVDGATASAAEMLAGALDRYRRGVVLGQRTYGKGCVQEYFRDRSGLGVLRLTTRLYTLPDGSPIQRRGLVPSLLVGPDDVLEREADVPGSLEPSPGPDVRVAVPAAPGWPPHSGRVGPCESQAICAALRRVTGTPTARARPEAAARKRHTQRPPGVIPR
jgi:carboxyl-terminal processing protease